ncbi:MAG: HAD-IA family hydrolase [Bacteroidetes bacterium]|nr:HAD-IA family hydrolase [Bacteroidota bacterium]
MELELENLENIILDLGEVLFFIRDEDEWYEEYIEPVLGANFNEDKFLELYDEMEHGMYSAYELKNELEELAGKAFSMNAFRAGWNARLLHMPEENMEAIEALSKRFNLYLLSNTNSIHYQSWWNTIREQFGPDRFERVFKGFFYSHELGVMKPNPEIYHVVHEGMKSPAMESCLFFDDNPANVMAAKRFGWQAMVVKRNLVEVVSQLGLV